MSPLVNETEQALLSGRPVVPDLVIGETQHLVAEVPSRQVSPPVLLMLFPASMMRVAVALDDEGVAHEEVDPADAWDLDLRPNRNVPALQEKPDTGLAARLRSAQERAYPLCTLREFAQDRTKIGQGRETQVQSRIEGDERGLRIVAVSHLLKAVQKWPHGPRRAGPIHEVQLNPRPRTRAMPASVDHVDLLNARHPHSVRSQPAETAEPSARDDGAYDPLIGTRPRVPAAGDPDDASGAERTPNPLWVDTGLPEFDYRVNA